MRMIDSKGKESTTLTFVSIAFIAVFVKFLIGGMTLPVIGLMPIIGAGEFGLAITGILAVWLNREWREAKHGQD